MPRHSILWDLCSQNLLWVTLEKLFIESEGKSAPTHFTYTGIYIFLSPISSRGRKMLYFVWIAKVEET